MPSSAPAPEWWFYATICAAVVGIIIAIIRTRIAHLQEETDKRRLSDEKFKMGVELFGSRQSSVRVGGAYVLADLAKLEPDINHVRVMDIFVSFLTDPPRIEGGPGQDEADYTGPDTSAIIKAINERTDDQLSAESERGYSLQRKLQSTDFHLIDGEIELKRPEMGPRPLRPFDPTGHSRGPRRID